MKIIHCADLHLDSKMTANLDTVRAKERKREILNTFVRMVDYAGNGGIEAILIAGDLFDTKNISALARNTVKDTICSHPEITFYYLLGNHDRDNFLSSLESIPDNLKLFSDTWTEYVLDKKGIVRLNGIELNKDNSGSYINSLTLDPGRINICMLHGQETDAAVKDRAEVISISELKNKNIDYLALGHIHSYKTDKIDQRGIYCYSGCLEGRGFDEVGSHGFVVLDIDTDRHTLSHTFVPFAGRELIELDVDITGISTTSQIIERIDSRLSLNPVAGKNLIKIVCSGSVDIECEKDMDFILKHYEPMYYFVKVYDESRLKVNFEDYRKDESLKGEFVRMVMNSELSESDRTAIIRIGLQAIAGEEIG